ncbi:small subunit ribosomal protein S15 [Neolewinella agarilytica]|uniref:Small ribosomal subunit protein uS15 n=2 Tax=Neolewinella agarilytica TaxID=478744 RepID=A0A1H9NE99_9BACT|nr:small subunit ribosomal protein S15 [Neolewinella agarilytica]
MQPQILLYPIQEILKGYYIMAVYLPKEKKEEIFAKYGGTAKNTGSTEAQIALFTFRIQELSNHLQLHRKDHSSRKALLTLVGKRRRHLAYLQKKDLMGYRKLIAELGIRK